MSKKDFREISKTLLFKTQKLYLLHKAQLMPEVPVEKLQITDEDMVPLDLLNEVMTKNRQKFERKKGWW